MAYKLWGKNKTKNKKQKMGRNSRALALTLQSPVKGAARQLLCLGGCPTVRFWVWPAA